MTNPPSGSTVEQAREKLDRLRWIQWFRREYGFPADTILDAALELEQLKEQVTVYANRWVDAVETGTGLARKLAEAEKQLAESAQEIERLRAELSLRRSQMSAFPFCPDHRDKVLRADCFACRLEAAEAELSRLKGEPA